MMSYKKPFLIVFTALVLACSIPVSASAVGSFSLQDENLAYFINNNGDIMKPTKDSPNFHFIKGDYEQCGYINCCSGSWFSFVLWIPLYGYYLVVFQNSYVPKNITWRDVNTGDLSYGCYQIIHRNNNGSQSWGSNYWTYYTEGGWANNSLVGLHSILGQLVFFYQLNYDTSSTINPRVYSSSSNYRLPDNVEQFEGEVDDLLDILNITHGDPVVLNGDSVPMPSTDPYGNNKPTLPNGNEEPTYPNDEPVITYTQPGETKIYTVPWNDDIDEPYSTIIYQSFIYILKPDEVAVTNPDTGEVLPDPNDSSKPWIEQVTIYNNENGSSEVNEEFSKLYDMISDMDDLSSIMESNQDVMSGHVDNVRNLVDTVTGWFPAPIIACMVCGAIMIIAVKITGSGKS